MKSVDYRRFSLEEKNVQLAPERVNAQCWNDFVEHSNADPIASS